MITFDVEKYYYDKDDKLFLKSSVSFEPGLTVLIGCNGSGKTTLLQHIKHAVKKRKDAAVFYYSNLTDGGSRGVSSALFRNDIAFAATAFTSSEGEQIVQNLGQSASKIGAFVKNNKDKKELFILLDALDSGTSIDNVREMKEDFFNFVIEDCKKRGTDIYVIVSANSFEMAKGEDCIDVSRLVHVSPKTYERYSQLIMRSRERKNKRYKNQKEEEED